jgi:Ca-activated chloride channel family protein
VQFGAPVLLLLLLGLPPVLAALLWLARWRRRVVQRLVSGAGSPISGRRRLLKAGLVLSALALLAVAAARPQRGSRRVLLPREGSDVMVALDVSASMLATDVAPNRLERAKQVLGALLDQVQGDRVGLVVFAGSAALRFPLTTDLSVARELIRGATVREGGLAPGTGLGEALRLAVSSFPRDGQARSRVVVLVTDGEDLAGSPLEAATLARERGIAVYTVGIGTAAGGPIVQPGPGGRPAPRLDPQTGEPATSRRDEGLLRSLAAAAHGRYLDGNEDDAPTLLAGEIGRLARTRFESQEGAIPIERFQWFAAAALLLLALDLLLPERRRDQGAARRRDPGRPGRQGERAA